MTTTPAAPRAKRSPRRRGWGATCRSCLWGAIPLAVLATIAGLVMQKPSFYVARLASADPAARHQHNNQFLNTASRLINDLQNAPAWQAKFGEEQINGWLAEDFETNHAATALPAGVRQPRGEIQGDHFRLGFEWSIGPISSVIQVGARAWVPERNRLAIELETAQAGWLPLPTTYPRTVIEQFLRAQSLDVSWKRNGRRLVALVDFTPVQRKIVLRRVEIQDKLLVVEGLSGRHSIPTTDYAPTAN